ncbi:hypothetical protein Taro_005151 [Colocasia esculenta]|uniref:Uncharacterized protein n=1 Tax=Colocasia esculenta TaxID=4460 RepID=A0A843TP32_COLES|nr:hypothetical protein [Colocasia esculenta]
MHVGTCVRVRCTCREQTNRPQKSSHSSPGKCPRQGGLPRFHRQAKERVARKDPSPDQAGCTPARPGRGTPRQTRQGATPRQTRRGAPPQDQAGGAPPPDQAGGGGAPDQAGSHPCQTRQGPPPPDQAGVPPPPDQAGATPAGPDSPSPDQASSKKHIHISTISTIPESCSTGGENICI